MPFWIKKNVIAKVDKLEELLGLEIEKHIRRWGYPESVSIWRKEVRKIKQFFLERPCVIKGHILDYFRLDDIVFDCRISGGELEVGKGFVYPNPNNGNFVVYSKEILEEEYFEVWVTDVYGKTIEAIGVYADRFNQIRVDLRGVVNKPSLYTVTLKGQEKVLNFKVFINL